MLIIVNDEILWLKLLKDENLLVTFKDNFTAGSYRRRDVREKKVSTDLRHAIDTCSGPLKDG